MIDLSEQSSANPDWFTRSLLGALDESRRLVESIRLELADSRREALIETLRAERWKARWKRAVSERDAAQTAAAHYVDRLRAVEAA